MQVDRCANQLSRTNFSASVYTVERIVFFCTRKKGALEFGSRADFVGLIGALVRIRVHVSRTLLRAVWARTEAARGEWGADFRDGCRGKEGFVGRLRYSNFCLGSVSVQNSEMSVGDGAWTSREYIQNLHFIPEKG